MTDNRETIEMLKMLKEQALKSHNDTAVLEVKIDSFNFVLDEAIKALEQTPKTWGLDAAREDFMNDVYNTLDFLPTNNEANRIIDSFDRVTSGLEQQPCEDCISRKSAIDAMIKLEQDDIECYGCAIPEGFNSTPAIEALNSLPSVTPKEKTGKWEVYEVVDFGDWKGTEKYKCSKCGEKVGVFKSNFCPNCGRKMVSE